MTKTLTLKEQRFVDAYLGSAGGNGVLAARLAGYQQTEKALRVTASRLLVKANIRDAVAARVKEQTRKSILTADERDKILSTIASRGEDAARIRAIAELNRCSGRHSIKHVLDVTETLSDIIAGSRK
jgi:phage terminase small subunit